MLLIVALTLVTMGDAAPGNSLAWYKKQSQIGRLGFSVGVVNQLRFDHVNLTSDKMKSCLDDLVKTNDYLWLSLRNGAEMCANRIDKTP